MLSDRRLLKCVSNFFLSELFLLFFIPTVFSQSWDIHTSAIAPGGATAEITDINLDNKTLTLKIYTTNLQSGEYKIFNCYLDQDSQVEKDGKVIPITKLRKGDKVYSEGALFDDTNRSCGVLKIVKASADSPQSMSTPNVEKPSLVPAK